MNTLEIRPASPLLNPRSLPDIFHIPPWPRCQSRRPRLPRWRNGSSYQVRLKQLSVNNQKPLTNSDTTGVDSEQLKWGRGEDLVITGAPASVEPTIEEDESAEAESSPKRAPNTPQSKKRNSYQRLSRLSDEARLSVASFTPTIEQNGTDSNRSSTTIKGIHVNGTGGLSDHDFEKALRKFASERDSFLSDMNLSAGVVMPNRPKPRPKTQKIVNDDTTGSKSAVGSIRRRISFRDMSSMKRQSSVARQGEPPRPPISSPPH